jgi:hypothetical protein
MTQDELVAKQALRIAELEDDLADREARLRDIHMTCVCIGGPLNDNVLGYTAKQLGPWRRVAERADVTG